jgi:hypothetical protein
MRPGRSTSKDGLFRQPRRGRDFATAPGVKAFEILIGRGLACCLHPRAAWQVTTRFGRAFVICAYAAGGFVTTLAALLYFSK